MREQATQRPSCACFFGYFLVRHKKVTRPTVGPALGMGKVRKSDAAKDHPGYSRRADVVRRISVVNSE